MKPFNEHNPQRAGPMSSGEHALHGDVIIFGENALPSNFDQMDKVKDACLAYGEATGHLHQIIGRPEAFDLRECQKTKVKYLRVVEPVMLRHQEHSPIEIDPGVYKIGIQREYDPFEKLTRQVAD